MVIIHVDFKAAILQKIYQINSERLFRVVFIQHSGVIGKDVQSAVQRLRLFENAYIGHIKKKICLILSH